MKIDIYLKTIESLLKLNVTVEEMLDYKKGFDEVGKIINGNLYETIEKCYTTMKPPLFSSNKDIIMQFIHKNKNIIGELLKIHNLYLFSQYDFGRNRWNDFVLFLYQFNHQKEAVKRLAEWMNNVGINSFTYTNESIDSIVRGCRIIWDNNQSILDYMTDGVKRYICSIDRDVLISISGAKYIYTIHTNSIIYDKTESRLILNRLDVELPSFEEIEKMLICGFPNDAITKRTNLFMNIYKLNNILHDMKNEIKRINQDMGDIEYDEGNPILKTKHIIENQVKELEDMREEAIHNLSIVGIPEKDYQIFQKAYIDMLSAIDLDIH